MRDRLAPLDTAEVREGLLRAALARAAQAEAKALGRLRAAQARYRACRRRTAEARAALAAHGGPRATEATPTPHGRGSFLAPEHTGARSRDSRLGTGAAKSSRIAGLQRWR